VREYAKNSLAGPLFIHFGVRGNPFGVTPDPRFLYPTHTHREALASLITGIECGFGFQVLIAQPGMGKTSLLFNLLQRFRGVAYTAFLFQQHREPHELFQSVLHELGTNSEETSLRKLSDQLNQVLCRAAREGKRVILIVDEAQNLEFTLLEALRQLSNFETPDTKLLQIIMAGQPQLAEKLVTPQQEQLRQRISAVCRLSPLALDETQAYINYRLATAGYVGLNLFSEGAVRMVWNRSKGVPRNINTLCFSAMLLAFALQAKSIDESILKEAERDLDLKSALADIYQIDRLVAVSGGNDKILPLRKTPPPEIVNEGLSAIGETVASASSISREAEGAAASTRLARNTASEDIPPSLVERLGPGSRSLEPNGLLMGRLAALPQPLSPLPIPLRTIPAEGAGIPASPNGTSQRWPTTPIKSRTMPAIRRDPAANPEKNLPFKAAEKEVPSERKSASDPAPRQPDKPLAGQSPGSEAPVIRPDPSIANRHSDHGSLWSKALGLTFTGILVWVLIGKFVLPHLGKVEGRMSDRATTGKNYPAAGYSVHVPASPTDGHTPPAKKPVAHVRDPKTLGTESKEVIIRRFPTDLGIVSKDANHRQELRRIFFDEDSLVIGPQYRPWLQQIADELASDSTARVILEGHTDNLSPEAHNLDLSSRRAITVRDALVNEFHIPATRVTANGAGSAAPLQPNSSAAGRAYNRRVEVRLESSSE
jgi:type II secretory pathway predicted ATPase ExeA/outer membrane protein OmpA-like peptidoglycan-associated protein